MERKAQIFTFALIAAVVMITAFVIAAPPDKECRDGIDNDGDGQIDWPNDSGCENKNDNDETDCGDGVCEGGETSSSCSVDCPLITQCNDNLDNDGDGHVDLADSECTSSSDDDESPRDFCDSTDVFGDTSVQGTASGEDDSVPFNLTDFCLDSTTLREYSCGGYNFDYDPLSEDINCATNTTSSCSNGACV